MSTTDTRAAFEVRARKQCYNLTKTPDGEYAFPAAAGAWFGWLAALEHTEATKATGTAGELPPLAKRIQDELDTDEANIDYRTGYLAAISDAVQLVAGAEAARQPAPVVAIKTWQERKVSEGGMQNPGYKMWGERFYMVEEIAELRAALAATAAPVLSDEQILKIAEEETINYVTDERRPDNATIIGFARAIIDATRSQP